MGVVIPRSPVRERIGDGREFSSHLTSSGVVADDGPISSTSDSGRAPGRTDGNRPSFPSVAGIPGQRETPSYISADWPLFPESLSDISPASIVLLLRSFQNQWIIFFQIMKR